MQNYRIEKRHISDIRIGDTVMHNGEMKTVGKNNLKYDSFMGYSLFGDSYKLGRQAVEVVIFFTMHDFMRIRDEAKYSLT